MKKVSIGTSGWSYQHWDQTFYLNIPHDQHLKFYAKNFKSVEVNTTFYHLPKKEVIQNWVLTVPKTFLFSVKADRVITHLKRLKNCKANLRVFYQRMQFFEKKLGPILFQLPPSFEKDMERLSSFISLLKPGYKYVIEFRSPSWYDEEVYALLKKNKIALCISDLNGVVSPEQITANFVYIRLHGPKKAYQGRYPKRTLMAWAEKIQRWNKRAYIYFDNDEKGYAAQDAKLFSEIMNL